MWTGCFHSPTLPEDALRELWPEDMLLSLWTCYLHSTTFPYGLLFSFTFGISATLADLGPWQPQIPSNNLSLLQCDFMGPLWYDTMADFSRMGANT